MSTVTTRAATARTGTRGPPPSPRAGDPNAAPIAPAGGGNGGNPAGPPGPPGPGGPPGGGAGGPPPQVPNPPAMFALTPARAVQGLIDYTTRHGQRLYEMATQPLETKFDSKPDKLCLFVASAQTRRIGWPHYKCPLTV